MRKFTFLMIIAFLAFGNSGFSQGLENFDNSNATSSYNDSNFVGEDGITWYYIASRNANNDANGSGINLPALMLRRSSSGSKVYSETITGGIGNFSIKLYKGFTGGGNRQVELFINDVSFGTSVPFDDYDEHVFSVDNINVSGDIVIRIDDITSKQVIVDDITWTGYGAGGVDNPTAFTASTLSTSQIDLAWTQNAASDNVMVAWTADGTFGAPVDGTSYSATDIITGGGTVIYNGSATSFNHSSLTAGTQYFYKAWSVDGTVAYSSGVTDDATTDKDEPTNHVASFVAGTPTASTIPLTWSDNDGAVVADGYLIKASTSSTFTDPVDGTPEADDTDMSDGSGQINVAHGVETYTFEGLDQSTQYFFKIWPYTNSLTAIDYKTDGTVPTANETTTGSATATLPYSQTFDADLGDCYTYSVSGSTKEWYWNSGAAAINGYNSGDTEEDWLIMPGINFDNYTDVIMTFDDWYQYGIDDADHYLKLMYSTDYTGSGDPSLATWTELTYAAPGASDTWSNSLLVDLTAITGTSVHVAFKYHYQSDSYRYWQIDNISIFEGTQVDVTFQVNMIEETVSGDGVHIAGNFQDWDPTTTPMTDANADDVYDVTLSLYSDVQYQFKYINGNAWAGEESVPAACQAPGETNRYEVIGSSNYSIDPVCFSACENCGTLPSYDITFRVNMQNETTSGDGVYLAGDFTTWATSAILMTNTSGDLWETTVSLEEATSQEYKFVNGDPNSGGTWEYFSGSCLVGNEGSNRGLTVPGETTTLDLVCFNSCDACPAPDLFFSEIGDPATATGRFVELYNASLSTIDFDAVDWHIVKQVNGGSQYDFKLSGSVTSGGKFVIAGSESDFTTAYGFAPDQSNGQISGNGDDGYYLYIYGDEVSGILVDSYGVLGEDGSGKPWDYANTKAVRLRSVTSPNDTWDADEWDIPGSADIDDMTPTEYREDVTWLGLNADDWNTKGGNWSSTHGFIPDASFNVTIPSSGNNPAIGAQSACNNLTLTADAVLGVNVGEPITVYENLVIASNKSRGVADFTVDSDANGNGSVIVKGTVTGTATVKRYFNQYTNSDNGWHYIGSPVDDMTILGSDFIPGANDDLFSWDEDDYLWRNYLGSDFGYTSFENGIGFMVAFENDVTKSFVGTLNTSDVTHSNLSLTPTKGDGWHLLGNPYASALKWNDGNWALTNFGGVAKVYDESAGSYNDVPADGIIPSTNGFFVQVSSATNSITIPAAARTHDATNNYKNSSSEMDETLQLLVNNDANGFSDRTTIGFRNDAEMSFDWAFDSHKMFGQATAPQLWTLIDGEQFSTNNLPPVYESLDLPLNFKAGVISTFHILAEGLESFYINSEIYLEDIQTGVMTDLREQPMYTFTGQPSDDNARFVLHFYGVTNVSEITDDDAVVNIYANHGKVMVKTESVNQRYSIEIYDIMGRLIMSDNFTSYGLNTFNVVAESGVYMVKLQSESTTHVEKINLR